MQSNPNIQPFNSSMRSDEVQRIGAYLASLLDEVRVRRDPSRDRAGQVCHRVSSHKCNDENRCDTFARNDGAIFYFSFAVRYRA